MIDDIDQKYLDGLTHAQKDTLVLALCATIRDLTVRAETLETAAGKPKKTSKNSSLPPSTDFKANSKEKAKEAGKGRPKRKGVSRKLHPSPDETRDFLVESCGCCHSLLTPADQKTYQAYDRIEIIVKTRVTRVHVHGGKCWNCGEKFMGTPPQDLKPGSPFGASIQSLALYMHYCHMVSYQRLVAMFDEIFHLKISEGAIRNIFKKTEPALEKMIAEIEEKILGSPFILSDETSARVKGQKFWQWVFIGKEAVLHVIKPTRSKSVPQDIFGDHHPDFWVSDMYGGQMGLGKTHQVCLAHQLRNLQYAIEAGDLVFSPRIKRLLVQAIRIGQKRDRFDDATLSRFQAALEKRLAEIMLFEPQTEDG